MRRMSDPAYLHTVTLDELMDNVFEGKSAVIENLLYTGAYILAGAPKIGKSFLVAQIAHHVSTGSPHSRWSSCNCHTQPHGLFVGYPR